MPNQFKNYDEAVNALSGGRGYAFLTGGQKRQVNAMDFGSSQPITAATGSTGPTPQFNMPPVAPANTVGSADLTPAPESNFQTFDINQQPIYPVGTLNSTPQAPAPVGLTPEEQRLQNLIDSTMGLQNQLPDEATFRAEQEKAFGVEELQKTQRDLESRLKAIQNEGLAIPLQLQQEATGRGITTGGLRPLETGRLRENAIQALGVNSLLEASRGNLSTALTMVDRAVDQKYGPIKAQIAVNLQNLNLIKSSPQYTLEQKQRAEAQEAKQLQKAAEIAKQETEFKAIHEYANKAVSSGASAEDVGYILQAQTSGEALQRAADFLGADFRNKLENDMFDRSLKEAEYNLSVDKFNEDIRQFGLDHSLQLRKIQSDELKRQIEDQIAKGEADNASQAVATQMVTNLDLVRKVKGSKFVDGQLAEGKGARGFGRIVGPNIFARGFDPGIAIDEFFTADGNEIRGYIKQITDKSTLQNLIDVKKQGATFGALQRAELEKLENAITAINNWELKEGKGEHTYGLGVWQVSEEEFLKELTIIEDAYARLLADETGKETHNGVILPSNTPDTSTGSNYQGIVLPN